MPSPERVTIELSNAEALVLFEWLHRMEAGPGLDGVVEDPAEKVALWNLSALLEREMVEPFHDDYAKRVAAARSRLTAE